MDASEQTAVRLCQQGDLAGLATLVACHQSRAIRLAALITRDPHLAEDVVAEAFLTAFRYIKTLDARRPFAPWFHRIVANTALKMLATRRREVPLDPAEGAELSGVRSHFDVSDLTREDALTWIIQVEDRETLQWALRSLPPRQRAAIVLKYFADLDEAEIAQVLGIPKGTVKSRIFNALARLRTALMHLRLA